MNALSQTLGGFALILFALSVLAGFAPKAFGRIGHVALSGLALTALPAAILAEGNGLDLLDAGAVTIFALHFALALGIWERNRWRT